MQQLFIGCLLAQVCRQGGIQTQGSGYLNFHETLEDALQAAHETCLQVFPESSGYVQHHAGVESVHPDLVQALLIWCWNQIEQLRLQAASAPDE